MTSNFQRLLVLLVTLASATSCGAEADHDHDHVGDEGRDHAAATTRPSAVHDFVRGAAPATASRPAGAHEHAHDHDAHDGHDDHDHDKEGHAHSRASEVTLSAEAVKAAKIRVDSRSPMLAIASRLRGVSSRRR